MGTDYFMQEGGVIFRMGVSIDEVGKGDVVRISPGKNGKLERVVSIVPDGKWDRKITTECGNVFSMMDIYEYGKRKD